MSAPSTSRRAAGVLRLAAALPLLAALSSAQAQDAAQDEPKAGFTLRVSAPDLALEGEPYPVKIQVTGAADRAVDLPLWALTAAALKLDGMELGQRAAGVLPLAPGQTLQTTIDLSALLAARASERPAELEVVHSLGGGPQKAQWLRRAETGIDFMSLPVEQLGDYQVVLLTTSGTLWLEFWPDVAPNHTRNFLDLAYTGFYDGSRFHRVIPGFMVQGGRGVEGREAPRKVKQEFSTRRHVAGVLSAARLGNDVDSATSEFFIVHKASPQLDGQYTAYGALIAAYAPGIETVESVVRAVDANYGLVRELRRAAPIDLNNPYVQMAINNPNPPQLIMKAIVVKAPRKR